ncbi:uncharacterized protein BDZ99DRAFT_569760 [Mytilinidion resinicola]|uniref:Uncharacterized protein n=1 Tax=Mytilinidion resinicola TaxID=574789 RepID=A0A6A6YTF1_9PEZI|nr:uncharacterized protein BDZ99DRAFT_569760 [Mytilinidion resinicola]KAF2811799.1 hypothetical protein BDZ99DRAFT_569760 [Mytilinidion resinicola]
MGGLKGKTSGLQNASNPPDTRHKGRGDSRRPDDRSHRSGSAHHFFSLDYGDSQSNPPQSSETLGQTETSTTGRKRPHPEDDESNSKSLEASSKKAKIAYNTKDSGLELYEGHPTPAKLSPPSQNEEPNGSAIGSTRSFSEADKEAENARKKEAAAKKEREEAERKFHEREIECDRLLESPRSSPTLPAPISGQNFTPRPAQPQTPSQSQSLAGSEDGEIIEFVLETGTLASSGTPQAFRKPVRSQQPPAASNRANATRSSGTTTKGSKDVQMMA